MSNTISGTPGMASWRQASLWPGRTDATSWWRASSATATGAPNGSPSWSSAPASSPPSGCTSTALLLKRLAFGVALLEPPHHADGQEHAQDGGVGYGLAHVALDAPDEMHRRQRGGRIH